MNYLITAAGKGSRFLKNGIKPPKPLIKVYGNELLIWSLNSFQFDRDDRLYIVTLKKDRVREILDKKLKIIFPYVKIFWLEIENVLNGQLLTAIEAINYFDIKGPLIIHNCDTSYISQTKEIKKLISDEKIFGVIPCFEGIGDHWSFARTTKKNPENAIEVREKVKISNNCSVGSYIFSSTEKLLKLAKEYFNIFKLNKNSEYYIAPIFQYAIEKKMNVKIMQVDDVKVFGTPSELMKDFQISLEELLGENSFSGNQRRTLVVDIDKTLCKKNDEELYSEALPIQNVCDALRKANSEGVYIILSTSRNMRTFRGSIGLINKITAPVLIKWLKDHQIPYDEIYFGKPWGYDVSYIDDKNLSIEKFIDEFKNK